MLLQPGARPVPNSPDYQLIRKLGAGAFGEVWHAHGPGGIDVALKFIRLDSAARYLELRSLEVMKSKRHPNLVSLFGAWRTDNWLILAMELCDRTLQDRLAEVLERKLPGIPPDELLTYLRDAASGLDYLNAEQVQHRDVKPANLLMLGPGVKVSDFGLAKVLEETVGSNTGAGTVAYMAPECFKGQLTPQSDQYSLAVTYYHLRTGRLPFRGNQAELMFGHLMSEPDLSRVSQAERMALNRALSKDPSKRWPSCTAFVSELGTVAFLPSREKPHTNQSEQDKKPADRPTPELHSPLIRPPLHKEQKHQEVLEQAKRAKTDENQQGQQTGSLPEPDEWSQAGGCGLAILLLACITYATIEHFGVVRIGILLPTYALCLISTGFFTRAIERIRAILHNNQR